MSNLENSMASTLAELTQLGAELLDADPKLAFVFGRNLEALAADLAKNGKSALLESGFTKGSWGSYELTAKQSAGRYDYSGVSLVRQAEERLAYLRNLSQNIVEPVADTLTGEVIEPATYKPGPLTIEIRKAK
jgi:hypothetical protein